MNLPIQAQPVMRNVSTAAFTGGMETSGVGCTITCTVCNALSGIAKTACDLAAKAAGCEC